MTRNEGYQGLTLEDAARARGKSKAYYRVLKRRHPDEFPKPIDKVGFLKLYDPEQLVVFDRERRTR